MPDILPPLPEATLPNGEEWPAIGLGTWRLGESADYFDAEVKAVRLALEMGYRVIDTAEMYGEGACEQIVGLALRQAMRQGLARMTGGEPEGDQGSVAAASASGSGGRWE